MSDFNSMQANLGLFPGVGQPTMAGPVKSPAQVAAELSAQATANLQYGASIGPQVARNMPQMMAFGQQFQQQFSAAQSMQSFNPYMANMMGGAMGGGAQMNLPSPIMMTPANMGVFRPPMQGSNYAPIPPMYSMPLIQTPFTPQIPKPMFQTAWDQEMRQRDYRADAIYSYAIQAPRAAGNLAGYGVGAFAGAAMGGRLGSPMLGAALGMFGAGMSGLSGGMGDLAMMPFRPQLEARQMGAGIQNMSQNFVIGGSQLHQSGMGLSRGASRQLATGIMDMVDSRSFQQQTGGAFSRGDMMQMLSTGGQAGLMDFAQNTDQIKEQLRKAAISVKKFMELTNDPDMNSIIRKMASMQSMGFSMNDMSAAAGNMRRYARSAGTSIDGIMEAGGAGAMLYQGMGLSGASGMNFGMFSAMAARQSVAAGVFSPAELALRGGVSGVAQRNTQAQAAMMSMPIVGASMSSFQNGSWGVNYGQMANQMSGRGGATGFVMGAANNLARAAQRGGVGALALYGLQSQDMNDEISRSMSPEQQMAMRYQSALSLGQQFGLKGAGAFAVGAEKMFGREVASDMLKMASNPQFWKSLREGDRRQKDELARQQYQDIKDRVPSMWDDAKRNVAGFFEIADPTTGLRKVIQGVSDRNRGEDAAKRGDYYFAETDFDGLTDKQIKAWSARKRVRGESKLTSSGTDEIGKSSASIFRDSMVLERGENQGIMSTRERIIRGVAPLMNIPLTVATMGAGTVPALLGASVDYGTAEKLGGWGAKQRLSPDELRQMHARADAIRGRNLEAYDASQKFNLFSGEVKDINQLNEATKALGIGGSGADFALSIGKGVSNLAADRYHMWGKNDQVVTKDVKDQIVDKMIAKDPALSKLHKENPKAARAQASARFEKLSSSQKSVLLGAGMSGARQLATAKGEAVFAETEADNRTGMGMDNWEDASAKLKKEMRSVKYELETMGVDLAGQQSRFKNVLLSTTAEQQTALGVMYGTGSGQDYDTQMATLKAELAKTNPGKSAAEIDALAMKTFGEVTAKGPGALISDEDKALLENAARVGGRDKFAGKIRTVSGKLDASIGALGEAASRDFTGTGFFGSNRLGDITDDAIASLQGTNAAQANAAKKYKIAKERGASSSVLDKIQAEYDEAGISKATSLGGTAQSLLTATGPEADQLNGSIAAIDAVASSMERAFANFTPAVTRDFAAGSKALAAFAKQQAEKNAQANPQDQGNSGNL